MIIDIVTIINEKLKGTDKTEKTELQNIELKGFGETELQPAIEYIKNKKEISKINTLILTDGYCDNLDFNGLPGKKMIITTDVLVNYVGSNVKQQKLEI